MMALRDLQASKSTCRTGGAEFASTADAGDIMALEVVCELTADILADITFG